MCLQKSDLCTTIFSWHRVARSPADFCLVWSPLSLARSLCVLAHCPFSAVTWFLPPSHAFFLRLLCSFLPAGHFWGTHLSDRGRSWTLAAVIWLRVGVSQILLSRVVLRGSLSPPPLAKSVARSPLSFPFSCSLTLLASAVYLL